MIIGLLYLVISLVSQLTPHSKLLLGLERPYHKQLEELMELTHTALDEVWKADGGGGARGSYPQARMAHLFDVIGAALCR